VVPSATLLLLLVATTFSVAALLLSRRRPAPGAVGLVALLAAVAVWNAGYALEIAAGSLDAKLLWAKAQDVGMVVVPLAVFAFALDHTGRRAWLTRRRLAAIAAIPAATLALAWTHELHHLVWTGVGTPVEAGRELDLEYGPGFYPGLLVAYALLFAATALLVAGCWSQRRYFRRQSFVVVVAVATPWLCNALHVLGLSSPGLDLTPIGFAVTAVCFALACGRWRLLDIAPVARDAVVEHLRDGMLVVDARGRIVDCNRAAAPLLSCPVEDAVGRTAADVLPPCVAGAMRHAPTSRCSTSGCCATARSRRPASPRSAPVRRSTARCSSCRSTSRRCAGRMRSTPACC
jgi:PAS domain-containing protein